MKTLFFRAIFIFTILLVPFFETQALTISPVRLEVSVEPGETYSGDYKLINETGVPREYYSSFENFESQGETGSPKFNPEKKGITKWLSGPKVVNLEANSSQTLPFNISVPADAEPGGYFGVIFWGNNPVEDANGQPLEFQVNSKVGILVLLTVEGDMEESAQVLEYGRIIEEGEGGVISSAPVGLYYRFQNGGADRVRPEGSITIKNTFGGETARLDANPTDGNVLPRQIRRYETFWNEGEVPEGFFGQAFFQLKNFHFGLYSAQLDLVFGSEGRELHDITKFWIIPWQLILTVLGFIIIVFGGGRKVLQGYKQSILKSVEKE